MQKIIFPAVFAVAALTVFFMLGAQPAHAQCQVCQQVQSNPQSITSLPATQQAEVIKNLTTTTVTQIVTSIPVKEQQKLITNVASTDPDAAAGVLSCLPQDQQKTVISGLPANTQASLVTTLPQPQQTSFITGLINQQQQVQGQGGAVNCLPLQSGVGGSDESSEYSGGQLYTTIQPILPNIFLHAHSFGFGGFGGFHHFR
jgi:hypothetical protein